MKLLAKIAMVASFLYYCAGFSWLWFGQMIGAHNEVWDTFGFPAQAASPPLWSMVAGLTFTLIGMAGLLYAYLGVWRILDGGSGQDFRALARRLHMIAKGLFGFWLGYNLVTGVTQFLIVSGLESTEGFDFGYDPLDTDVLFLILSIALFAIANVMHRAWEAEEENKLFL
ncbi:MAG: hypothetical protein AAFQ64_19985 [Pseudomonadota bacterium]